MTHSYLEYRETVKKSKELDNTNWKNNPEKWSIVEWSETEAVEKRPWDNGGRILAIWWCILQRSTENIKYYLYYNVDTKK